jgi:hypothetical protein
MVEMVHSFKSGRNLPFRISNQSKITFNKSSPPATGETGATYGSWDRISTRYRVVAFCKIEKNNFRQIPIFIIYIGLRVQQPMRKYRLSVSAVVSRPIYQACITGNRKNRTKSIIESFPLPCHHAIQSFDPTTKLRQQKSDAAFESARNVLITEKMSNIIQNYSDLSTHWLRSGAIYIVFPF